MSLQEFLRSELVQAARRATAAEVIAEVERDVASRPAPVAARRRT